MPRRPNRLFQRSPWVRRHRRLISAGLAAIVVAASAVALSIGGASPAPTWNLAFPQTLNYRVLGQNSSIECKKDDATFEREVSAAGLDGYEMYLVMGRTGTCARLKAEQLKRLHPEKMVILYQNTGGSSPTMWPGGTWAGYYLMMNRTKATAPVSAAQTSISVTNPALFSVGDSAVMWSPSGSDPYANSEWVKVTNIVGSTLTVSRDVFATGVRQSYAQAPFIAAGATGPSYPYPVYNMSDVAPVNPANGERANQWMAQNIVADFAASGPGAATPDAVELDTASWAPPANNAIGSVKNFDCNGDGIIDYCNENVGTPAQVNSYGVGYDKFVQFVKQGLTVYDTDPNSPAKLALADGELGLRSLASANGAEFESFPSWDNYDLSSPALDTLGVWQSQSTAPGAHISYAFSKDVTPVYPQVSSLNPSGCVTPAQGGTCRNGAFRYGIVAALLNGSADAYNNEDNFTYTQAWDEEATINQATTGLAPGYLGQPLAPPVRTTRFTSANLTLNPDFETGTTSVSSASAVTGGVSFARDTTTAAPGGGAASLRTDVTGLTANPATNDSRVSDAVSGSITPGEYTVDFWAKALNGAAGPAGMYIGVGLDGVTGPAQSVLLSNTWTHYYLQMNASTTMSKNAALKFFVGSQIGSYWLDNVSLHQGTAGIITREFTNGIVVLNDSFTTQTAVALTGGTYHHINGVQDRSVNNGAEVGSTLPAIAAKDGEILLRDPIVPPTTTTTVTSTTTPPTTSTVASSTTTTSPTDTTSTTDTTSPTETTTTLATSTTTVVPAPQVVGGVRAAAVSGGVSVSWNPAPVNGYSVQSYVVSAFPGGRTVTVPGTLTHANFVGLGAGVYTFRVRVQKASGSSAWSTASNAVFIAALTTPRSGYWMLGSDGRVYAFADAREAGWAGGPSVAISARADGTGYWVVDAAGDVWHLGTAAGFGGHPALGSGEVVSTISATPTGNGYWLFTNRGRVFPYGDAHFYGDMSNTVLNGPIIASVATATGHGYYMVGSDGGVFSFGDARFHGSTGGMHLNRPIVGISPTPDNRGYWLVASDGGVFAFSAAFRGSMGGSVLAKPVNGLVAYGNGYLMVASDGGIFDFSDKAFGGSLGGNPPSAPIIGVAAFST